MLDNPNLAVRFSATHQLVKRGGQTLNAMLRTLVMTGSPLQKAHGLWILQRFKGEIDIQLLAAACKDNDVIVRMHATPSLSSEPTMVRRNMIWCWPGLWIPTRWCSMTRRHWRRTRGRTTSCPFWTCLVAWIARTRTCPRRPHGAARST